MSFKGYLGNLLIDAGRLLKGSEVGIDSDPAVEPALALIPGPVLESVAEFVTGVVEVAETSWGAKCAPLSVLQKILGKPKSDPDTTDDQIADDGKKVIKVSDAIKIVKETLDGFAGTTEELFDVIRGALPVTDVGGTGQAPANINLSHVIAEKLRSKALKQTNKRKKGTDPQPYERVGALHQS